MHIYLFCQTPSVHLWPRLLPAAGACEWPGQSSRLTTDFREALKESFCQKKCCVDIYLLQRQETGAQQFVCSASDLEDFLTEIRNDLWSWTYFMPIFVHIPLK